MANTITLENLIESIYNSAEGFRHLYAKNLLSKKLDGNSLSLVADIIPYIDGGFGDLYIIKKEDNLSVSRYPDEKDITHIISLHARDKPNFEFIIKYLNIISYACDTSEELIKRAIIPSDSHIRQNIMEAYECYYTLIGNEVLMNNLFKDLNKE